MAVSITTRLFWLTKRNLWCCLASYIFTIRDIKKLLQAIICEPEYNDDRWILV